MNGAPLYVLVVKGTGKPPSIGRQQALEGGLQRAVRPNNRAPQTSRLASVFYPRDAYDQAGGTLVGGIVALH